MAVDVENLFQSALVGQNSMKLNSWTVSEHQDDTWYSSQL